VLWCCLKLLHYKALVFSSKAEAIMWHRCCYLTLLTVTVLIFNVKCSSLLLVLIFVSSELHYMLSCCFSKFPVIHFTCCSSVAGVIAAVLCVWLQLKIVTGMNIQPYPHPIPVKLSPSPPRPSACCPHPAPIPNMLSPSPPHSRMCHPHPVPIIFTGESCKKIFTL